MEKILSYDDWKLEKQKQRKIKSTSVVIKRLFNSDLEVIKIKTGLTKLQKPIQWARNKFNERKSSDEKKSSNKKKSRVILVRIMWMVVSSFVYSICRQFSPLIESVLIQWFPNKMGYIYMCIKNSNMIIEAKKKTIV